MEELTKALEGFFRSPEGGLLVLLASLITNFAVNYHTTREWNLRLAIGYLLSGVTLVFCFLVLFPEQTLFGIIAAIAQLQAVTFFMYRLYRWHKHGNKIS